MPADDLSEDSDSSVLTDQFWCHDRSEDGEQIRQLSYQKILTVVFRQTSFGIMIEVKTESKYAS